MIGASLRRKIGKATIGLLLAVFVFFAVTLVMPISTMGDPVYDTAMLRARWYGGFGIAHSQIVAIPLLILLTLTAGDKRATVLTLAALVASVLLFVGFILEEGRIIQYGDLIGPRDAAERRLLISRLGTFGLSLIAVISLWQSRPHR
jgi:hypothetical protein